MLNIMREKEELVSKIFSDIEKKLTEILCNEFKEFDNVIVKCHAFHDELELQKDGKTVKFHLASNRYNSGKKPNQGLYFKRFRRSVLDFNEKEFKNIQARLQSVYEK